MICRYPVCQVCPYNDGCSHTSDTDCDCGEFQAIKAAEIKLLNDKVLVDRKQLQEFEKSKVKTVEWLRKYTMISDDIVLSMCQAALRVFIDKELLEAKKETASK